MKIKFICKNCGSVNEKEKEALLDPDYSQADWLCDLPLGFQWVLPVGKISPVVGSPLYVSSIGGNLSREEYLERYNIDPEIAYQLMRQDKGDSLSKSLDPAKIQSLITGRKA
ncbi:MAG TPA: hypothetical protein PKK11_03290 [Methanothrix sp.]|nr:hypothetical protein [Methanothrix sp.]HPT19093.1 hypothetical protein [Methanothrix sp.]